MRYSRWPLGGVRVLKPLLLFRLWGDVGLHLALVAHLVQLGLVLKLALLLGRHVLGDSTKTKSGYMLLLLLLLQQQQQQQQQQQHTIVL